MFLKSMLHKPDTQKALVDLLIDTFQNEKIKQQLLVLLKHSIISALGDPKFRAYLGENLLLLLSDKNLQAGVAELLNALLRDDSVNESAQVFIKEMLKSQPLATEATKLGKSVIEGVVNDPDVQKKTGDGLWSALGYTVTPRWLSKKPAEKQQNNKNQTENIGVNNSLLKDPTHDGAKDSLNNEMKDEAVKAQLPDTVVGKNTEELSNSEEPKTDVEHNENKKAVTTNNGDL
jgi:hypothetical protein